MDEIEIKPLLGRLSASIRVPGSKSITNRALLIAAMAGGRSQIQSALISDDTRYMIGALERLGFAIGVNEHDKCLSVEGQGGRVPAASADLFVGGSGTAMRFLAGFLTLGQGPYRLDGNARMRQRPIRDLIAALKRLGVRIESEAGTGCPPVTITVDAPLQGGVTSIDASLSSQFVSALLLPSPLWPRGLQLTIEALAAEPFIVMTLKLMEQAGIHSVMDGNFIRVAGGQSYQAGPMMVEADASSASYFAAAALLCRGTVRLLNLNADSVQGDIRFLELLEQMGARVSWQAEGVEVAGRDEFKGVDVDMSEMPDVVPTLAAIAPLASTPTRIRNVGFIRHHESDRIHALAVELGRLGVAVRELEDGLVIEPSRPVAGTVATYDDHRLAMSFAILGLRVPGIRIQDPACVSKTYPGFFVDLASLG